MHFWHIPPLQAIDRIRQVLTTTLILNLPNRIGVSVDSKHQSLGYRQPMQGLTLTSENSL